MQTRSSCPDCPIRLSGSDVFRNCLTRGSSMVAPRPIRKCSCQTLSRSIFSLISFAACRVTCHHRPSLLQKRMILRQLSLTYHKTLSPLGNLAEISRISCGFLAPHVRVSCLLTLPFTWKVASSLKRNRSSNPLSPNFSCIAMQK